MPQFLAFLLIVGLSSPLQAQQSRKPHSFIPTINELTEEEEKKVAAIIDRFILYDIGKLRGAEGQQALKDFQKLGPDAIPSLIRGLNRAAEINHSCPVTVIAGKLQSFFGSTNDLKMLQYARDEIGAGVGKTVHGAVIQDLRFFCSNRRNALVRAGVKPINPALAAAKALATADLIEEIGKKSGDPQRFLIVELGQRNGDEVIDALYRACADREMATRQAAANALYAVLYRSKPEELKDRLKDEKAEIRLAAIKVVSAKALRWGGEVIDRLEDEDANVRLWARGTLTRMAKQAVDYGPDPRATKEQRAVAVKRWRDWWEKQGSR